MDIALSESIFSLLDTSFWKAIVAKGIGRYFSFSFLEMFITLAFLDSKHSSYNTKAGKKSNNRFLSHEKLTILLFCRVTFMSSDQYFSDTKFWISRCRWTTKPKVGNWQGPQEITWLLVEGQTVLSLNVWSLVKIAPSLKSISCLASTASDSSALG